MTGIWIRFASACIALGGLSGCGTMYNLNNDGAVYGGVTTDLALGYLLTAAVAQGNQGAWETGYALGLGTAIMAVDLPLSLAADTLTLPLTSLVAYDRLTTQHRIADTPAAKTLAKDGPPAKTEPSGDKASGN